VGSADGLDDAKILALDRYERSELFDEAERAALALADAMTATPQAVTDALVERARAALGLEATVELLAVVAWENAVARFNHACGAESWGLWRPGGAG
jgi:alkylhydroperoxidase family enzyme